MHFSGLIQRRLDHTVFSNSLQEFVSKTDILPAVSTDHSRVTLTVLKSQNIAEENGFKKFNSSLIHDEIYLSKMKEFIQEFKTFLKHEIWKFTINYLKNVAKKPKKTKKQDLFNKYEIRKFNYFKNIAKNTKRRI